MRATALFLLFPLATAVATGRGVDEDRLMRRDGLLAYSLPQLGDAAEYLSGTLTAEVEVLPSGEVGGVRFDPSQWPFGEKAAADAITKWRFVPLRRHGSRWRTVKIVVPPEMGRDGEAGTETAYEPPLTLQIQRYYPTVRRWPRVNGKVAEKRCEVHGEAMHIELVPFGASGPPPPPDSKPPREFVEFEEAFRREFPNSSERAFTGCVIPRETQVEIYVCGACRLAKQAWLNAHPGFRAPY